MSEVDYKKLITELGKNIGLDELKPDEDLYCCLGFDDKITVHFQYNQESETLMLFSQLGIIDEDKLAGVYPKLMKANVFWQGTGGSTLGVDDENNEVILSYQVALSLLDFTKFQELLEGFVNTAELWIDTIVAINRGEISSSTKESDKKVTPPPPGMRA